MQTPIFIFAIVIAALQQSPFSWLCGTWLMEGGHSQEVWLCEGEMLRGYGLQIRDGSQQMSEQLEIVQLDGDWYYIATVPNQNDATPVRFKAVHISADSLAFENPAHDFPRRITYKQLGPDSLRATISDMADKKRTFLFTKQ